MGSKRLLTIVLACALGAAFAGGAHAAALRVLWLKSPNHASSARKIASVDRIVIHVTEGSFWGAVTWLRNPRSHGSSHYVVSKRGDVVQLVSTSDVAWHAGNRWVNRHSIGIEHEGRSRRGGFTDAQYRASARLVAYLATRAGMPIDRRHVIGHDRVPDPDGSGVGGFDHHTDPGRKWNWRKYMRYVRLYAKDPQQPRYTRRVPRPDVRTAKPRPKPSVVRAGAVVRGVARWDVPRTGSLWGKGVYRVEFLVDGELLWRDRVGPFAFGRGRGWDTRKVANGRHLLTARVYGRKGYRMLKRYPIRVNNKPIELALEGIAPESGLRGDVAVAVKPSYPVRRVVLYVDGKPVSRDSSAPYALNWDSTGAAEGPHDLVVYARTAGGRRAARAVPVVVANGDLPPTLDLALDAPLADAIQLP
jgi:N-acetyl-anhydromuramyl-L-alanine amidase AmpD